jgi:hypothetical protein
MIALDPGKRAKLVGAARLLSSDKPGEVVAALGAIDRLLPEGVTIATIIEAATMDRPQPVIAPFWPPRPVSPGGILLKPWKLMARSCLEADHLFDDVERAFLRNMWDLGHRPSFKQEAWLSTLADRVEAEHA